MLEKVKLLWKYRKEVRTALGRHIALLEGDSIAGALGGLTDEEIAGLVSTQDNFQFYFDGAF